MPDYDFNPMHTELGVMSIELNMVYFQEYMLRHELHISPNFLTPLSVTLSVPNTALFIKKCLFPALSGQKGPLKATYNQ